MTPNRRYGIPAVAALMLLGSVACGPADPEPDAAPDPPSAAPCAPDTPAPALTTLDWETARQQSVPDDPPPGFAAEWDPGLVHRDNGKSQVSVVRAPDPVRAGGAAARFELRRGDPVINHGTRAELATPMEPRGADRWYGFSIYLPPSWARDSSPEILAQWHQDPAVEGNPPLAISTYRGEWEILAASDGRSDQQMTGAYQTGRWTDWLVHVKWSTGADGVLQVFKDGKAVAGFADRRGPNTYRGKRGNYFKVGIYKWDWSQKKPTDTTRRIMYLDELRIATTRAGAAVPKPLAEVCYRPDATP